MGGASRTRVREHLYVVAVGRHYCAKGAELHVF